MTSSDYIIKENKQNDQLLEKVLIIFSLLQTTIVVRNVTVHFPIENRRRVLSGAKSETFVCIVTTDAKFSISERRWSTMIETRVGVCSIERQQLHFSSFLGNLCQESGRFTFEGVVLHNKRASKQGSSHLG